MKQHKIILWVVTLVLILAGVGLYVLARTQRMASLQAGYAEDHYDSLLWAVHVLDVGQGDAIFVELPDGIQILVDGGVDNTVLSRLSDVMMPWDRSIDYIVISHPHADHINGLIEVLDRFDVANVVIDNVVYDSVPYEILKERVIHEGAVIIDPDDEDRLVHGRVVVDVIYPSPEIVVATGENINEKSTVLKIDDGTNSILLTGDAGDVVEEKIGALVGDIDVLKVGHHGSTYGTSREFLNEIDPELAVISVGEGNEYHHPHKSTLKRLTDFGVDVFRTDLHGTVSIEFFADRYEVDHSM
ncbi:MBL fold metallo-hydrolase [Candidatus Uhrbacteria bacterium]|jgi:competence protein ComEC|nr:MBL fold metallo-hydrolase [Candidatus Uhrbacteria bacterium]